MKSNELLSTFLEVVGYLVLCGSAGYLMVHLMYWIDGVGTWAVDRRWKQKCGETAMSVETDASEKNATQAKSGQPTTDGKGGEL